MIITPIPDGHTWTDSTGRTWTVHGKHFELVDRTWTDSTGRTWSAYGSGLELVDLAEWTELATAWSDVIDIRIGLHVGEYTATGEAAIWDLDLWDDPAARWGGGEGGDPDDPDAIWTWIDCDIQYATMRRGRTEWSQNFDTGSLTATLYNLGGRWTPSITVPGQQVPLRIGRIVRLEAKPADAVDWEVLYTGKVTKIIESMNAFGMASVKITAADAFSFFGRIDFLPEHVAPPHEEADERIHRILDKARWPANRRDIQPVDIIIHDSSIAGNALAELKLVAESAGAELFVDARGRVALYPGDVLGSEPTGTPVGILSAIRRLGGSDMFQDPPVICIGEPLTITTDIRRVVNDVHLVSKEATAVAVDEESIARYGVRTWQRTNLLTALDADLEVIADTILARSKDTAARLESASIIVTDTAIAAWILARKFGDHIRLEYLNPFYGWRIDADAQIVGITHTITENKWLVTLATDDAFLAPEPIEEPN